MLTIHDLEGLRRSAAMAPLSQAEVLRLIDDCDRLLRERQQITAALAELPTSWATVRTTLNQLHRLLRDAGPG